MSAPRLLIAGTSSGVGKTTFNSCRTSISIMPMKPGPESTEPPPSPIKRMPLMPFCVAKLNVANGVAPEVGTPLPRTVPVNAVT